MASSRLDPDVIEDMVKPNIEGQYEGWSKGELGGLGHRGCFSEGVGYSVRGRRRHRMVLACQY